MKIKVAIISCGMIANSAHIPAYKHFEDFEICAVCDINEKSARETAEKHNIPKYYTDADEMLEKEKPQLVSVCVPNMLHKEYTMKALKNGANVICEKPLAVTYEDAKEMYDFAEKTGKILVACQSMRFTPDRLAAKKKLDENKTKIYYGEFSRIRRRGTPTWGTFHIKEKNGGGCFIDIGVHMLDAILWLAGNPEIKEVIASCGKNHAGEVGSLKGSGALTGSVDNIRPFNPDEMNVEDFCSGSLLFENGLRINFKTSWCANLPDEASIRLSGEKFGITLPEGKVYTGEDGEDALKLNENPYSFSPFSGHFYVIDNVRKVLKGEEELIIKPEETLNVTKIIEMIYKSAEESKL